MNLGFYGMAPNVLESNDWTNPNCVPDIILIEIYPEMETFQYNPEEILKSYGYRKIARDFGLCRFFILET